MFEKKNRDCQPSSSAFGLHILLNVQMILYKPPPLLLFINSLLRQILSYVTYDIYDYACCD